MGVKLGYFKNWMVDTFNTKDRLKIRDIRGFARSSILTDIADTQIRVFVWKWSILYAAKYLAI